ncbi:MAG: protein-(glutamine-N5) methyltransferase, release factor-specific [Gammaproteobacteria bacterium]|jgi:release factor glutamine methyltransferase|nr:protein-(glutamine-N5) methyltransferase, release factor-specific [Gammaproteobacteria bacterium]|tara:strand:+ start:208 stop:1053 length:846 start_codon:yes stop_codon:yes gene_type:complete
MAHEHQQVGSLLQEANLALEGSGSPSLDCQLILAFALGQTREWLIANSDRKICEKQADEFRNLILRRKQREPVAYILGRKEFWNSQLAVTRDTLVPRPETELLVETLLNKFDDTPRLVVDLGTGSGAIAVALASERPNWQIVGVDISQGALEVAKGNGSSFPKLSWMQGFWGNALRDNCFDLLVCNPPYIAENDPYLDHLGCEPQVALVSDDNGLADLYLVIQEARHLLKPGGHVLLEHGHDQQQQVCNRLKDSDFDALPLADLQGHPRAVLARKGIQVLP